MSQHRFETPSVPDREQASLVLVHGAWHGSWAWGEVARQLRSRGRLVEVPDLPGSDGRPGPGLDDQVAAIVTVLHQHDRIVVVAHSFGAVVARQAAANLPRGHVEELVLVDGWVVENGQSFFDVMPTPMRERCEAAASGSGKGRLIPAPAPAAFGVTTEPAASWLEKRLTAQPWATFAEPSRFDDIAAHGLYGRAITCQPSALPFRTMAEHLGYPVTDLHCGHDAMVLAPKTLTSLIDQA